MLKVTINPEIETEHYRYVRNSFGSWTQFIKRELAPMAINNPGLVELLDSIANDKSGNQAQP